mgnify:CR=1 FL=1
MLKKLQTKFILILMSFVSVILLSVFGVVCCSNYIHDKKDVEQSLEMALRLKDKDFSISFGNSRNFNGNSFVIYTDSNYEYMITSRSVWNIYAEDAQSLIESVKNKDDIGMDEIDEASDRVLMGPAKVSRKVTDYEKNIVAYHESGHAVLGIELPNGEEVHKITIIPRGMAGGYTQMLPKEERTLVATKDELLQRITSYLGGRVSEELFCGEISTGASDDFKRATQIARSMVTEYGMSDLGPVQFEHKSGEVFLGRDYTNSSKNYSDAVALEIDKEIRKIINECYKNAKDILSKNKGLVEALAKTLYEKETITKEEIEEVVREYNEGKKTKKKDKVEE